MLEYAEILKEDLVTALGCTEPIAIAFLAARFADTLGEQPTEVLVRCSGNIIKNVKSVIVPNTCGQRGIEVATLAGIISKKWNKGLEVLDDFSNEDQKKLTELLKRNIVRVEHLQTPAILHIIIEGRSKNNTAYTELIHSHTNIVKVIKNGKTLFENNFSLNESKPKGVDRSCLNIKDILHFADTVDLSEVSSLVQKQEKLNMKIATEGFKLLSDKSIAKVIYNEAKNNSEHLAPITLAKVELASAIEARMNGLCFPVVSNSGSGNQGLCVSIPVIVFAREKKISEDKKNRALIVSNLIANHQKTGIGKLSAYCGAISATTAAMAAVAYMFGYDYEIICKIISNSLATISGMVCDGAKASCASKAVAALDVAYLSYNMAISDVDFKSGDGIVKSNIESTISAVGVLAKEGMKKTDEVLLNIILDEDK